MAERIIEITNELTTAFASSNNIDFDKLRSLLKEGLMLLPEADNLSAQAFNSLIPNIQAKLNEEQLMDIVEDLNTPTLNEQTAKVLGDDEKEKLHTDTRENLQKSFSDTLVNRFEAKTYQDWTTTDTEIFDDLTNLGLVSEEKQNILKKKISNSEKYNGEIDKYVTEVENSEKSLNLYLSKFPKIKNFAIEAVLEVNDKPLDCAIAFGSAPNILNAYEYLEKQLLPYNKKEKQGTLSDDDRQKQQEIEQKLAKLDKATAEFLNDEDTLKALENDPVNLSYGFLQLAKKIEQTPANTVTNEKGNTSNIYENITKTIAISLHSYDNETFGNLTEEELTKNYVALTKAMENDVKNSVLAQAFNGLTFTDDNGKTLPDKEQEQNKKDVIALAKLMACEKLVQIGVPENKDLLTSFVKEQIEVIMAQDLPKELAEAAERLDKIQKREHAEAFAQNKQKLEDPQNAELIARSADLLAKKERNFTTLSAEEKQKLVDKYKEKINNKDPQTIKNASLVLTNIDHPIYTIDTLRNQLRTGNQAFLETVAEKLAIEDLKAKEAQSQTTSLLEVKPQKTDKLKDIRLSAEKTKYLKHLTKAQQDQTIFKKSDMIGRLAAGMTHNEKFQDRIKQKFGKGNLYKSTTSLWGRVDKWLTKRCGKKYTQCKKVIKTVAQFGWGFAKSYGMMTAAAAIGPVGIAGYMSYLAYTQGKAVVKAWKDPNTSKLEKYATLGGALITGALTVGGIGGAVEQLGAMNNAVGHFIQEHTPAVLQNLAHMTSQLSWGTRAGIVATAQTMPNMVKGIVLRSKIRKKHKEITTIKDPVQLNKCIMEYSTLRKEQSDNIFDGCTKAIGTVASVATMSSDFAKNLQAQCLSAIGLSSLVPAGTLNQDATAETTTQAETQSGTEQDTQKPDDVHGRTEKTDVQAQSTEEKAETPKEAASKTTEEKTDSQKEVKAQSTEEKTDSQKEVKAQSTEEKTDSQKEVKAQSTEEKADPQKEADSKTAEEKADPQKEADSKTTEEKTDSPKEGQQEAKAPLTDEQKAENLAAAQEKGSGHMGKSDYDSIVKNLLDPNNGLPPMSPENAAQIAQTMGEIYGTNSYEAAHAALAAPNALAQSMGLEGYFTSAAMLNYLQTHPECADNTGLHSYVDAHFDSMDRYHSSEFSNTHRHTSGTPHQQNSSSTPTQTSTTDTSYVPPAQEQTITFTSDQKPEENYGRRETVAVHHEPVQNGWRPLGREEAYIGTRTVSTLYGEQRVPMTLYDNLNSDLYEGVIYTNGEKVMYKSIALGTTDKIMTFENAAQAAKYPGGDQAKIYVRNNYGHGYNVRTCYGTGVTQTYNMANNDTYATIQKASIAVSIAGEIAHTAGAVMDMTGGDGKTAHKIGIGAQGAGRILSDVGNIYAILNTNNHGK